ncbi:hypothetical protein BGZ60DRAFT_433872 [Tricladium varicosporioides]|nr:hypothetical protein BGZ60DRAFT_433872 [Hymenoscyphus varicosporioides]
MLYVDSRKRAASGPFTSCARAEHATRCYSSTLLVAPSPDNRGEDNETEKGPLLVPQETLSFKRPGPPIKVNHPLPATRTIAASPEFLTSSTTVANPLPLGPCTRKISKTEGFRAGDDSMVFGRFADKIACKAMRHQCESGTMNFTTRNPCAVNEPRSIHDYRELRLSPCWLREMRFTRTFAGGKSAEN